MPPSVTFSSAIPRSLVAFLSQHCTTVTNTHTHTKRPFRFDSRGRSIFLAFLSLMFTPTQKSSNSPHPQQITQRHTNTNRVTYPFFGSYFLLFPFCCCCCCSRLSGVAAAVVVVVVPFSPLFVDGCIGVAFTLTLHPLPKRAGKREVLYCPVRLLRLTPRFFCFHSSTSFSDGFSTNNFDFEPFRCLPNERGGRKKRFYSLHRISLTHTHYSLFLHAMKSKTLPLSKRNSTF